MVKVKISKGIVARLLMVGIVLIVVILLSKSTGLSTKSPSRVGLPALGHFGPS